jgi:hypothetical protein
VFSTLNIGWACTLGMTGVVFSALNANLRVKVDSSAVIAIARTSPNSIALKQRFEAEDVVMKLVQDRRAGADV